MVDMTIMSKTFSSFIYSPRAWFIMVFMIGAAFVMFVPAQSFAATNIDAIHHWAWNDIIGWIDFYNGGNSNVLVTATSVTGTASSSIGAISLSCATCGSYNYNVTNSSTTGSLGGWAWNDSVGWISFFWGNASSSPTAPTSTDTQLCYNYSHAYNCGVYITADGEFHGYAWSNTIGWISFNYEFSGSPYWVQSSWTLSAATATLDSATFDTGAASGVELNSVMWQGSLNGLPPQDVAFQFAVSTSSAGPWIFGADTYSGNPNTPIPITNYSAYAGFRYFRYRITLTTDSSRTTSPRVSGVSVDWSP
jgi:hypothetical protein